MNNLMRVSIACLSLVAVNAVAKTELVVYTDIEPEMLNKYSKAFQQQEPDITIKWIRDSAGPISARLLAEKETPKADLVFGLTVNALMALESYQLFDPFQPTDFAQILPKMKDTRTQPIWIGVNAWTSAFCVNQNSLEKQGLSAPKSWQDLLKAEYKGQVIMPNPVSSGTGYMAVATWLQAMGDKTGWQYMSDLNTNIKMYTHSGCKPCQMAAQGETTIGISAGICAKPYLDKKAPLAVIMPTENIGWEIEAVAILKSSNNKPAAQKLMNFAQSESAAQIALDNGYIPNRVEFLTPEQQEAQKQLVDIDSVKSSQEREQVLSKWRIQFDSNQ